MLITGVVLCFSATTSKLPTVRGYVGITMLSLTSDIIKSLKTRHPDFPNVDHGVLIHRIAVGSPADRLLILTFTTIFLYTCNHSGMAVDQLELEPPARRILSYTLYYSAPSMFYRMLTCALLIFGKKAIPDSVVQYFCVCILNLRECVYMFSRPCLCGYLRNLAFL